MERAVRPGHQFSNFGPIASWSTPIRRLHEPDGMPPLWCSPATGSRGPIGNRADRMTDTAIAKRTTTGLAKTQTDRGRFLYSRANIITSAVGPSRQPSVTITHPMHHDGRRAHWSPSDVNHFLEHREEADP